VAGDPPIAAVLKDNTVIGYLFSTHETVHPAGYSGISFDIVVALREDGVIVGHHILEEHEPLITTGIFGRDRFKLFLDGLNGIDIGSSQRGARREAKKELHGFYNNQNIDAISGATISAFAMREAIVNSALRVGYLINLIDADPEDLSVDFYSFSARSWSELITDGSIVTRTLNYRDVRSAFSSQLDGAEMDIESDGKDDDTFITLYVGLATLPSVGRNLFGVRAYRRFTENSASGEQHLFIGSEGSYSWIPPNSSLVSIFHRIQIRQGDRILPLLPGNFYRARRLAIKNHPRFNNAARFRIPSELELDPLESWTVELRVFEEKTDTITPRAVNFSLPYRIPSQYVIGDDRALEDAGFKDPHYVAFGLLRESALTDWQIVWLQKRWSIVFLIALLGTVTSVMFFHHSLCRFRRIYQLIRVTLLATTLVWLGWIAGTQLSILNVINYLTLLVRGLDWGSALYEPLMVILVAYVGLTLILWGRGVFCGWLCPFGALQELLNKLARAVRLPQLKIRHSVQQRLWATKYLVAGGILAIAAYSLDLTTGAAEIEPFKTAITLKFDRSWPYVLYAGTLLIVGLFVERFFCRYLCPLGAVLAIGGRFHMLDWLKRRNECGNPCQICSASCPIGAIDDVGTINMNECLQCLDCQVDYADEKRCPALVRRSAQRRVLSNVVPTRSS
ncbi:MAG: hypothetical protein CFH36_01437, partial [Alphaproteobacteria bacterium MarineAlpha9_Bin6]